MKNLKKTTLLAFILFFSLGIVIFTGSVNNFSFIDKNNPVEVTAGNEAAHYDEVEKIKIKDRKSGSASVFNYNFLFNLFYKFAYGELTK